MDQYAEEKRTEKNLIVRSGISEAETTNNTRSSAIADKPRVLVCTVVEVWKDFLSVDFLSVYVDKKFTYICYRRLIRHE